MSVQIIIKRKDLPGALIYAIENLSSKVIILDEAVIVIPASGKMVEFLHLLRENNIPYETGHVEPQ